MSAPLILAFDTAGPHCTAALCRGPAVLAQRHLDQARGQAESLMPLLQEVLEAGGADWADLDAIGVGIGPGNFTGIRISVAAARGAAMGLGIPAIGASMFDVIAAQAPETRPLLVSLAAPRDQTYVQALNADGTQSDALLVDPGAPLPPSLNVGATWHVLGHRAGDIAKSNGAESLELAPLDLGTSIAAIAAAKFANAGDRSLPPPSPMYVRAPDAAPPSTKPPRILGRV